MNPDLDNETPSYCAPQTFRSMHVFLLHFLALTLTYGVLTSKHFASDSYGGFYDLAARHHLIHGRPLITLLASVFERVHFYPIAAQEFFTLLLIGSAALSATLVVVRLAATFVELDMRTFILLNLAVMICYVNVFLLEWFLFPEFTLYYSLALLSATFGFWIFSSARRGRVILTLLLVTISLNFYQASLGFFVIPALTWVMLRHRAIPNRSAIYDSLLVLVIGAIGAFIDIAIVRFGVWAGWIISSDREPALAPHTIISNVDTVLMGMRTVWTNALGFLPNGMLVLFALPLLILLLNGARVRPASWQQLLYVLVVTGAASAVVFAPHLLTAQVWIVPRSIASFFGLFMILIVAILMLARPQRNQQILLVILPIFLVVSFLQIQKISANHIANNKLDIEIAQLMLHEIEAYEEETGNTITHIAMQPDESPTWGYAAIEYLSGETNTRAFLRPWADVALLRFVSDREFIKIPMPQEALDSLLSNQSDWLWFDAQEQMRFKDNEAYILVY